MLAAVLQERRLKHRCLIPAVVGHEVADDPHTLVVSLIEQLLIVLPRAVVRIHLVEVQGVVAVIVRRLENGRKHDGVEAKLLDVVEFLDYSLQGSPAKYVLTLWRYLPASVESVYQQMIDTGAVKPKQFILFHVPICF